MIRSALLTIAFMAGTAGACLLLGCASARPSDDVRALMDAMDQTIPEHIRRQRAEELLMPIP